MKHCKKCGGVDTHTADCPDNPGLRAVMTGAVVREWVGIGAAVEEHNAAIRQQAAEIERLTTQYRNAMEWLKTATARAEASEARASALLAALEKYGVHGRFCYAVYGDPTGPCNCGLDAAIASAKGETA